MSTEPTTTEEEIQKAVRTLKGKVDKFLAAEAQLAAERYRPEDEAKLSDEAYHRAAASLKAERVHY